MTVLTRPIKMRQWWYSCLFDVYMDCCSLSVTGPQTSTSQAILIKRYNKHYRHVKSPYECFMDQNGVHGYWDNNVFYCHWPSTMYTSNRQLYHHCLILIGLVSTVILKSYRDTCCCRYRIHLYSFILFKNEWMLFYLRKRIDW
jgi:hypothetical protein